MIYLVEDDESIRELVVYTLNSQGLAYHHQFHFLRHHGKRGKLPFGIFFIVFFRICQCYQMSQGPGHYIVFSFQGSVPLLTTVEDSGNVSGNGWLLRNY